MARAYRVVDVFAESRFEGNPLTVFLSQDGLDGVTMQRIARETNHSETTFIGAQNDDGTWPVRIFTPARELPFAGHPTLGTASVIAAQHDDDAPTLRLGAGDVPVSRVDGTWWMRQPTGRIMDGRARATFAAALGIEVDDVSGPVERTTTGIPFWIVPLASLRAAHDAALDLQALRRAIGADADDGVLVFTDEVEGEADLHVRCFTGAHGIPEDPATGSANGCLATYLAHRDGAVDAVVEQGLEIGRPSRLHIKAVWAGDHADVDVGGNVVPVAEGHFF